MEKYGQNKSFMGFEGPSSLSQKWKGIVIDRDVLRKGMGWMVGDGEALIWFEQHDNFNRWPEIKEVLLMRFGTGKDAERLRDWAEIRQAFDELKLRVMVAKIIASKQMISHDDQCQLDIHMETNLAKAEMLVARGADTHIVGYVFEEQLSHVEHVEPNLTHGDKENHAHKVFDQMSRRKNVKRKKKRWKQLSRTFNSYERSKGCVKTGIVVLRNKAT
ncbi:unnamed protein product [Cochlearia groenlandica]